MHYHGWTVFSNVVENKYILLLKICTEKGQKVLIDYAKVADTRVFTTSEFLTEMKHKIDQCCFDTSRNTEAQYGLTQKYG